MIAAQLVLAVLAASLIALATAATTRLFASRSKPTRFVWMIGMIMAMSWPLLTAAYAKVSDAGLRDGGGPLTMTRLETLVIQATAVSSGWPLDSLLLGGWFILSGVLLGRIAVAMIMLGRQRAAWHQMRVDGTMVRVSDSTGPAVIGLRNQEIVIPAWSLDLAPSLRTVVLRHEREHCDARDPLLIVVSRVLIALLPWNLPLWWLGSRLRLAIETDCDARVLRHETDVERYGMLLLMIAQRRAVSPALATMLSEPTSHLERRIRSMRSSLRLSRSAALSLASTAVISILLACAVPDATEATSSAQSQRVKSAKEPVVVGANQAYFEFQVEKQAAVARAAQPRYPDMLRAANVEGEVLAQFVVDTMGKAEMSSFKVIKTSHDLFSNSVRDALPQMTFHPAAVGGRKVRQVVQMPFQYALSR
jgi:bla regulator protein blaR1